MDNILKTTHVPSCPYLGMRGDASAYYGYPSSGNRCYHCRGPATPLTAHQATYCLTGAQSDCPVYSAAKDQTFPRSIRLASAQIAKHRHTWLRTVLLVAIIILLAAFLAYQFIPQVRQGLGQQAAALSTTRTVPTLMPTPAPTTSAGPATLDPIIVPPPMTAFETLGPAPAPTSTAQQHALEVAVRVDGRTYLIHRVKGGDTFEFLAGAYHTTPAVIRALNYGIKASLWANTQIVVSPGLTTLVPELPAFQAREVKDNTTIDALARSLKLEPALLRNYNACTDDCALVQGDWIIVPHVK